MRHALELFCFVFFSAILRINENQKFFFSFSRGFIQMYKYMAVLSPESVIHKTRTKVNETNK